MRIIACRQCPERFTEYEEYQKHKVVHVKSFECDVCHKSFSTKYFLKLHYPIHMETKPFQCDRCSRSFSQASTLRRHIYLHEAEKKFMCELCGKCRTVLSSKTFWCVTKMVRMWLYRKAVPCAVPSQNAHITHSRGIPKVYLQSMSETIFIDDRPDDPYECTSQWGESVQMWDLRQGNFRSAWSSEAEPFYL